MKTAQEKKMAGRSLRNADANVLDRTAANQTRQDIKRSHGHASRSGGFIVGVQGRVNIRESINVMHDVNKVKD